MAALSLSDALSGRVTACGGPGLGACDVRSSLAAPSHAVWGPDVSAVISLGIGVRL